MSLICYIVLPILGSFFIAICLFYGIRQLGRERKLANRTEWTLIIGYSMVVVFISLFGNGIWNLLVLLLMPLLAHWMYQTGRSHLFYYFSLVILVYLSDAFVSMGWVMLANSKVVTMNSQEFFYVSLILVLRLVEFLVIRLFILIIRRHMGGGLTAKQVVVSLIFPGFSVVNLLSFTVFMRVYLTEEMILLFLGNMVLLIGINIYFAVLVDTIGENNRLENELALSRQQACLQMSYYEREEEKYDNSRKLIHDIRNHIQMMEQLYQEKNKPNEYLQSVHTMLNSLGQQYYTANKLLNIILNDKVTQMQKCEIQEDIKIGELDLSFMKEMDITTIFANLLDNAINAASKTSKGWIRMRVQEVRGFVSITMENSCQQEPVKKGRFYRSSKPDHEGLGMKNIERAVEQYHGDLQCQWKEGVFYTQIMLAKS